MATFQSFLVLFLSFLLQIQMGALGWEIGLVLPCVVVFSVFLSLDKYSLLVLFSLFLTRWSPDIFNLELWFWLGSCFLIYGLKYVLPLRSWLSVLILTLVFSGIWGWFLGSGWSSPEVRIYLAASLAWSFLIFILFRNVLGYETVARIKYFPLKLR